MKTKLRRILVPLDGSKLAESALDVAVEIATASGASLTLLHVLESHPPDTVHGEPHLTDLEGAREYLEAWVARLHDAGVSADVHAHSPGVRAVADELARHADEVGADLIVMCAHGSGGLRDALLGNIAQQTLKRCVRPVLLVRAPTPDGGWGLKSRPWVVAIEPADHGPGALPVVAALAEAMRARIELLTVVPTRRTLPPTRRAEGRLAPRAVLSVLDLEAEDATRYLEGQAGELREEGLAASVRLLRGDPVKSVLRAVRGGNAALLVVATHRRAGLPGLIAGGFAAAVVGRTDCPLLLIPLVDET